MTRFDDTHLADFVRDGFCIVRKMFDGDEIDLLQRSALEDRRLDENTIGRHDGEGGTVRLSLWNQPGDNVYGMFARCRRVVDSMEKILDGEVYHYHSKMIFKDPLIGGAFAWHQDYGYWYDNACLFPFMASVAIAVDSATRENGCMQVLAGSHELGRVDHVQIGVHLNRVIRCFSIAIFYTAQIRTAPIILGGRWFAVTMRLVTILSKSPIIRITCRLI